MRFIASLLAVALLGGSISSSPQVLYDDFNRPFPLHAQPQRIISLAPNITEILYSLGLGDRVVGVTRYCDFPEEAKEKEKVGGLVDFNPEKIQALEPDLIIGFRGNPIRLLDKLRQLGFPVFILDTGKSLEDLFSKIKKIGQLTGATREADELVRGLETKRLQVDRALTGVQSVPPVFLALPGQKFWTCGRDNFLHDLIVRARGRNIAAQMPRQWLRLNPEHLLLENPAVIVLLARDEADFERAREWYLRHPHLQPIKAIREKRLFYLQENLASRFGPRLLEAYAQLASFLHPERFSQEK